ncbi:MAG: glycine cleavage system aminomethyltransferase GcvT [Actinobacteria bacterium]|nr:glycine cleavage system aminomethyltransferase GcvT [Actinomycetota bacterium]
MTQNLRTTPLHSRHLGLGAKMADFGGWDMPIEYTGVLGEHAAVRECVGLFDVSHMGKVLVRGSGALSHLNRLLTNDLHRIADGQAQYSLMCDADGGVIDDLIVYRWNDSEFMIIPNASNASDVVHQLRSDNAADVEVIDHHDQRGIIAVQGPRSAALLERLGLPVNHEYMSVMATRYKDSDIAACRSGYTGELGFEIVAPAEVIPDLWDELLERGVDLGVQPAGLGARDTLRTEMGYPLHGHELSREISPVQARLGWAVGWDKTAFVGREALSVERAAGPRRVLRAVQAIDRAIPRAHMSVQSAAGREIGEVTSGTFSPTLKMGIGLALLDPAIAVGDRVFIDVRGRLGEFEVVATPFVPAHTR